MEQIAFFTQDKNDAYQKSKPKLQALPLRERPAYRVTEAGADACGLAELLAAIVGGAQQIEIAYGLLARFDDVDGLARASVHEIEQTDGVGHATAARIKAALEFGRRMTLATAGDRLQVRSPADIAAVLMTKMAHLEQEHFTVIILDTRNRVLDIVTLYVGSLNATHVRVAEVFRDAIRRNAAAIIVAHNHPSGDPTPSPEDVTVTKRIVDAGEQLDIDVLDHLVIGKGRFISLRERGLGWN